MRFDIRPTLSALLRNRTGAVLVAVQIAFTLAIVVNAVYIAERRLALIERPTGLDDQNIFVVSTAGFTSRFHYLPTVAADLAYLRGQPGVIAATTTESVPLSEGAWAVGLSGKPNDPRIRATPNIFLVDEQGLRALGVKLIVGRDFRATDVGSPLSPTHGRDSGVIITRSLARKLHPQGNALGPLYYTDTTTPLLVLGIIDRMFGADLDAPDAGDVVLQATRPAVSSGVSYYYLVRTRPGERDRIMRTIEEHLSASNRDRVIDWIRPLTEFKRASYANDTLIAGFLAAVTVLLLAIAALGIFGLATFNVTTRTKQIGTRRAVGAKRRDVVAYFMLENAMITAAGVVGGCVLALGVGYWLSVEEALPPLDLYYLVGGVLGLYAVGQLAAWYPARTAARVPPAVATRTV